MKYTGDMNHLGNFISTFIDTLGNKVTSAAAVNPTFSLAFDMTALEGIEKRMELIGKKISLGKFLKTDTAALEDQFEKEGVALFKGFVALGLKYCGRDQVIDAVPLALVTDDVLAFLQDNGMADEADLVEAAQKKARSSVIVPRAPEALRIKNSKLKK